MQTPICTPVPPTSLKHKGETEVIISHKKSVKRIYHEEVAAGGMTTKAVGEWSSLARTDPVGVLVLPRPPTLEQVDHLTDVTMHTGEEEEAPVHEKVPSQREEKPIPEEATT
ncbi:uncharacterized protein A4U43_C04F26690 [Asparagus officinalis]|uniref:Uncharacterized protein n=1 Tax=Asparagus officinalis TaxID=4686 RepID=A0A5P1F3T4_ASPOF|nr:uncharacterized protein A4U43_C04F26690 [Asparagus officinalis]